MLNFYSFLYLTLSLSVLAIFLLIIKRVFLDKLSPRWQYGVWSILALRILVPLTGNGRELTSSLLLMLETVKNLLESGTTSAYSQLSSVTKVLFPLPWIAVSPVSITDWLFLVYAAGFWLTLLWYATSYCKLRRLLRKGRSAPAEVQEKLCFICEAYKLNRCRICEVDGLTSSFICGVFRPVLAIPSGTLPEDNILLHELLHLRYQDVLQNLFWCYFKALNWCNPFLRYICRQINNDLESLCDQRVLERLSGEERRAYGLTLLAMANERYPHAPGTTSLSNGGAFIAKRIEAIARFKQYPQGMSVVSVCLCMLLTVTFFFGNVSGTQLYDSPKYVYGDVVDRACAYASARLYRCTTLAGALDTYAKGLINENLLYLAAASPLSDQQAILNTQVDPWLEINDWQYSGSGDGYSIYNLHGTDDGFFTGQIIYEVGPAVDDPEPPHNTTLDWYAIYPVTAYETGGRWVVKPDGSAWRQAVTANDLFLLPWMTEYRAEGESGTVSIFLQNHVSVNNQGQRDFWGNTGFDHTLRPDAEFASITVWRRSVYTCTEERDGLTHVGMQIQVRDSENTELEFSDAIEIANDMTGSSNDGYSMVYRKVDADWDGLLQGGSGSGYSGSDIENREFQKYHPYDFAVRIFWNGNKVEDLYPKEVQ